MKEYVITMLANEKASAFTVRADRIESSAEVTVLKDAAGNVVAVFPNTRLVSAIESTSLVPEGHTSVSAVRA